ncbi:IS3 family transposase [Streptomyces sp. 7N604]|uniref:IS3 family transposase n=1 Tax=Streptomyces sp. 7N604 TaxID=3457415 RepID=UPI003FD15FB9
MTAERLPVQLAARVLPVAEFGYHTWKDRPPSAQPVRDAWLTEAITGIHLASRGTYGSRRVHAGLDLGSVIHVSHGTVEPLLSSGPASRAFRAAVGLAPTTRSVRPPTW